MTAPPGSADLVEVICETSASTIERWKAAATVNPDWMDLSSIVSIVPTDADRVRVRVTVRFVDDCDNALGYLYRINQDPDTFPAELLDHFEFYADCAVRKAQEAARLALIPYRPLGYEPPPNTWTMHWPQEYAFDIAAAIDSGMRSDAIFLRISDCPECVEATFALTVPEILFREINAAHDRIARERIARGYHAPIFAETVWVMFTGRA